MQFGLSTHLFHAERLARPHLEAIAAAGFGAVEIFATRTHFDYSRRDAIDALAEGLAATGLQAVSMHLPISTGIAGGVWGRAYSNASPAPAARQEAIDEASTALDAAARLGCGVAVLHLGIPDAQPVPPGDNDLRSVTRSVTALAARATDAGVRLALEVIPNALSTPDALRSLFDGDLELGTSGVCLDVGHAHMRDGAPDAAEALSGHVITTHLHDNHGVNDDHLVPFEGTIDWAATLMALSKTGFDGPLMFEVDAHGDAGGVLERSVGARARLQAILDGLMAPFSFSE